MPAPRFDIARSSSARIPPAPSSPTRAAFFASRTIVAPFSSVITKSPTRHSEMFPGWSEVRATMDPRERASARSRSSTMSSKSNPLRVPAEASSFRPRCSARSSRSSVNLCSTSRRKDAKPESSVAGSKAARKRDSNSPPGPSSVVSERRSSATWEPARAGSTAPAIEACTPANSARARAIAEVRVSGSRWDRIESSASEMSCRTVTSAAWVDCSIASSTRSSMAARSTPTDVSRIDLAPIPNIRRTVSARASAGTRAMTLRTVASSMSKASSLTESVRRSTLA